MLETTRTTGLSRLPFVFDIRRRNVSSGLWNPLVASHGLSKRANVCVCSVRHRGVTPGETDGGLTNSSISGPLCVILFFDGSWAFQVVRQAPYCICIYIYPAVRTQTSLPRLCLVYYLLPGPLRSVEMLFTPDNQSGLLLLLQVPVLVRLQPFCSIYQK